MKTWKWLSLALGLVAFAGATAVFAHGMHGPNVAARLRSHVADAEDFVDATPQQRQTIDQSVKTIASALEARMSAHKGMHQQLVDTLAADQLDTGKLYALADQRAEDIRALAKAIVPEIQKIHDALTPAQRQKLAARAKKHAARWNEGE